MPTKENGKPMSSAEKAAIVFLLLGEERGAELMMDLDDDEIAVVMHAMSGLGMVQSTAVEQVMKEFTGTMQRGADLVGNFETAEKMLLKFLPQGRAQEIMGEIRGPLQGKNMWERFSQLNENMVAGYLRGEAPQTVAVILSKLRPEVTAKVMPLLGSEMQLDVIMRMIEMEAVPRDVIAVVEDTLQNDFMVTAARTSGQDPHERMAEIFNRFDPENLNSIQDHLESQNPEALARIKQKMFTFEDMLKLDPNSLSKVIRKADNKELPKALKGATEEQRNVLLQALPERSRNILNDEIDNMGPVRMREVQDAQQQLVDVAKDLAAEGEIVLPQGEDEDPMVY